MNWLAGSKIRKVTSFSIPWGKFSKLGRFSIRANLLNLESLAQSIVIKAPSNLRIWWLRLYVVMHLSFAVPSRPCSPKRDSSIQPITFTRDFNEWTVLKSIKNLELRKCIGSRNCSLTWSIKKYLECRFGRKSPQLEDHLYFEFIISLAIKTIWLRGYVNNTIKGYLLMVKSFLGKG